MTEENRVMSEYERIANGYFNLSSSYKEKYRLGFHLSPPIGWLNDPNGLVYYNDEYHIYYQFSAPFFDNCAWGHISTKDFINYKYHPLAICPCSGEGIWSGSIVIDKYNSSKLFNKGGGLVAVYTRFNISDNHQRVDIATSIDGRNFKKYVLNPVISNSQKIWAFRDPKVFWCEKIEKWIAIIAGGRVRFYSSNNLIDWEFESECNDIETECPDIFPLKIDNSISEIKWVLSMAGRFYIIGDFDGHIFTPLSNKIPINYGVDSYASQTFYCTPDNRRICISWMDCWDNYNRPFQSLSLPVKLSLKRDENNNIRLYQFPIDEMKNLIFSNWTVKNQKLLNNSIINYDKGIERYLIHLEAFCECNLLSLKVLKSNTEFTLIGYKIDSNQVFIDRSKSGNLEYIKKCPKEFCCSVNKSKHIVFDVWVDSGSIELFINGGAEVISTLVYPKKNSGSISLETIEGFADIIDFSVYGLKSFNIENKI